MYSPTTGWYAVDAGGDIATRKRVEALCDEAQQAKIPRKEFEKKLEETLSTFFG
jgi:hypothetical protein